jgi:hypothetical protein
MARPGERKVPQTEAILKPESIEDAISSIFSCNDVKIIKAKIKFFKIR